MSALIAEALRALAELWVDHHQGQVDDATAQREFARIALDAQAALAQLAAGTAHADALAEFARRVRARGLPRG